MYPLSLAVKDNKKVFHRHTDESTLLIAQDKLSEIRQHRVRIFSVVETSPVIPSIIPFRMRL
mgnify:CR=1 FL=1